MCSILRINTIQWALCIAIMVSVPNYKELIGPCPLVDLCSTSVILGWVKDLRPKGLIRLLQIVKIYKDCKSLTVEVGHEGSVREWF